MKTKYIAIICCLVLIWSVISCKKFVAGEIPKTEIAQDAVFSNDASATAAIIGLYSTMASPSLAPLTAGFPSLYDGWSADELDIYTTDASSREFYSNALLSTNSTIAAKWTEAYSLIYAANSILEGLGKSTTISDSVKNQLTGEAKFIRGFCHLFLVSHWGDVPIVLTTDFRINTAIARSEKEQVYEQIVSDLEEAKALLAANYIRTERVRPNKSAASALLARAYLYQGNWEKAEAEATAVIDNTSMYSLQTDLTKIYAKNGAEAIWQLMPVRTPGLSVEDGSVFYLFGTAAPTKAALNLAMVNGFENGDLRKNAWVGSVVVSSITYYFAYKSRSYASSPNSTEYNNVLRLGEQYLIRAEARIQQDNIAEGIADLNTIRDRATDKTLPEGDPNRLPVLSTSLTKEEALQKVEQERRVELFSEGHRWIDLVRTGRAEAVLSPLKPSFKPTSVLFPIPRTQILNDPHITQNDGY